jgi:hypothetical protein
MATRFGRHFINNTSTRSKVDELGRAMLQVGKLKITLAKKM